MQKGFGLVLIFAFGLLVITILSWSLDLSGTRLQNKIPPSSLKSELIDSGVKQYEFNKSNDQIFYLKREVDKTVKVKAMLYDVATNTKKLIAELDDGEGSTRTTDYEIFRIENGESYFTIHNKKFIYKFGLDERITPYKLTSINDILSFTEKDLYQLSNENVLQVAIWCQNVTKESKKVLLLERGEDSYYFVEENSGNLVVFSSYLCERYGDGAKVDTGNNFVKLIALKNINFIQPSPAQAFFDNQSDPIFQIEIINTGCRFINICLYHTNILFEDKVLNREGSFVQNKSNYYLSKENDLFISINEDLIKIFGN